MSYAILKVEANAVGYWREGEGFVSRIEYASLYPNVADARERLASLKIEERWAFLIRGASLFVIVA